MASGKEIKSRIKTVKNTGKITKAMELISTVKMKKAQESVLELRSFALSALSILEKISGDENIFAKYTTAPETGRELVLLIASQKGLCWGYNINNFKKLIEYTRLEEKKSIEFDFIAIGKRSRDFILRMGQNLVADFSDEIIDPVNVSHTRRLVRFIVNAWNSGDYEKITIVYSHYMSAISQLPVAKAIFPFQENEISDFLSRVSGQDFVKNSSSQIEEFKIEPSPQVVLDYVIPMIMDAMIHETILEARASEHAARMVAMKNAKDAANKKASALTLIYNKARQGAITTEITEIVSGVEAMKD